MRCANPQSRHCLRDPIAAQVSSVPPRILQLAASSQKPQAIGFFDRLAWLVHECSLNFFPATAQTFQLIVWEQWRCGISACTLLWLSGSLLKILFNRHLFTRNRSRTLRFCSGTLAFGEIGSCEFRLS